MFKIENSIKLEDLKSKEDVLRNLIYPLEYLSYPKYKLDEKEKQKVSNGVSIDIDISDGLCLLVWQNELAAIADIKDKKAKICKMFLG